MNEIARGSIRIALAVLSIAWVQAFAAPIVLVPGTVNMFRDTRAANDVGITPGDRLQYGANIVGGSAGTTLGASYPSSSVFIDPQSPCNPLAVNPNFCGKTTAFNLSRTAVPWTFRFERLGETPLLVAGPSLAGTGTAVPFPVDVTISGSGLTPTISWTVPGGFSADAIRIQIFDKGAILPTGQADIIHSVAVPASGSSYSIPLTLNSGQTLHLGGNYAFNVQLIGTRGDPAVFDATNNNAEILRRSSSFFDFSPLLASGPPVAFLPTVVAGVYNFSISSVGPSSVTFIDPLIAVGYDYAIGAGDPNFASVLLPTGIGDNFFDLFLWDGFSFVDSGINLTGGSQFFFGGLGVARFSIRGIEASADLDPNNVTAFITGLTFVNTGHFTGTMTPITVAATVPEPGTELLIFCAALALAVVRRRALLSHPVCY